MATTHLAASLAILALLALVGGVHPFTPTHNLDLLARLLSLGLDDTTATRAQSPPRTHVDILRTGLVRSVAKYFRSKQTSTNNSTNSTGAHVIVTKADTVYATDLHALYVDYLGAEQAAALRQCGDAPLGLATALDELSAAVESVDFDAHTKDLPSAHFDANSFAEANERVRSLAKAVVERMLVAHDAPTARRLAGQLLHTVHDFYAHSNWIEMMGHHHAAAAHINDHLGSADGPGFAFVDATSIDDCRGEQCIEHIVECDIPLECPVVYYECKDNVRVDKLTSGYYAGQRGADGRRVVKPAGRGKCSHGGILDSTAREVDARGGINKDTPYFVLSPRADLHAQAARLATDHTELYFDELRAMIGDEGFDEMLQLTHGVQLSSASSKLYCFFRRLVNK